MFKAVLIVAALTCIRAFFKQCVDHANDCADLEFCAGLNFPNDYTGSKNTTATGRTCQHWASQQPHQHGYNSTYQLDAPANSCRNPKSEKDHGPWCYTMDPDMRFEYCFHNCSPSIMTQESCEDLNMGTEHWFHKASYKCFDSYCVCWRTYDERSAGDQASASKWCREFADGTLINLNNETVRGEFGKLLQSQNADGWIFWIDGTPTGSNGCHYYRYEGDGAGYVATDGDCSKSYAPYCEYRADITELQMACLAANSSSLPTKFIWGTCLVMLHGNNGISGPSNETCDIVKDILKTNVHFDANKIQFQAGSLVSLSGMKMYEDFPEVLAGWDKTGYKPYVGLFKMGSEAFYWADGMEMDADSDLWYRPPEEGDTCGVYYDGKLYPTPQSACETRIRSAVCQFRAIEVIPCLLNSNISSYYSGYVANGTIVKQVKHGHTELSFECSTGKWILKAIDWFSPPPVIAHTDGNEFIAQLLGANNNGTELMLFTSTPVIQLTTDGVIEAVCSGADDQIYYYTRGKVMDFQDRAQLLQKLSKMEIVQFIDGKFEGTDMNGNGGIEVRAVACTNEDKIQGVMNMLL